MRELLNIRGNSLLDRFRADKRMIGLLDQQYADDASRIASLDALVRDYNHRLKSMNIRDWVVEKGRFSRPLEYLKLILMVISFPFYLTGLVNNLIPYMIPVWYLKRVKDVQFHSSIKYVMGTLVFPLYYAIISANAALFIPGALFSWLYILCIPISGIFAYNYYIWMKKLGAKFRFLKHLKKVKGKQDNLVHKREKILKFADEIILSYLKPA